MKTKYLLLAVLGLTAWGCAQENTPSTGETAREYLTLWMDKYHPGVAANTDGLYILEDKPGTGDLWDSEMDYSYVEVTVKTLGGTVSSTSDETLSKQLGTYVKGNYYGPRYQAIGKGYSYAGFDALLSGMRVGGQRQAVVPAWMLTTSRYNTQQEYIDAATVASSLVYDVKFCGQTEDVSETEKDSLATYVTRRFGNIASVNYKSTEDDPQDPDGTFFFVSSTAGFTDDDARGDTSTGTINYTGRLLNGQVFDTTIEKVAKDAGIYDASKTYSPQKVTFATAWDSIALGESTSLIDGFKGGLFLMKYVGQKAVVIFTSTHGYTTTGKGDSIPAWSPLQFELELVSIDKNE